MPLVVDIPKSNEALHLKSGRHFGSFTQLISQRIRFPDHDWDERICKRLQARKKGKS